MKKIIVGYEKYDFTTTKGWNLNGRIHNGSLLKSFYELNLGPQHEENYHSRIFQITIDPHNFPESYKDITKTPLFEGKPIGKHHISVQIDRVSVEKYFYPIVIFSIFQYTEFIAEIEISDKVRKDVQEGKCYIVFIYTNEGDLRFRYREFCAIVDKLNLPKEQIIVFHGDFDEQYFQNAPFVYVPNLLFKWWLKNYRNKTDLVEYKPNKLFLTLNRNVRNHKLLMLAALIKYDLLDQGIYSCGKIRNVEWITEYLNYPLTQEEISRLYSIEMTSPDKEISNGGINNIVWAYTDADVENTFLSLVTESLVDGLFFSEKTFKPIVAGQPFIILAGSGHLELLKKFGYKTFSDYWDESYDIEIDLVKRVEKIIQVLQYLNSLSTEKLISIRQSMIPILEHNQKVFTDSLIDDSKYDEQTDIKEYLLKLVNK